MTINWKKFLLGIQIVPKSGSTASAQGDVEVDSATTKMNFHNGTTASPVVTETHTSQGTNRLTNKDLEDSSTKIVDASDTTKKIAFDAAGTTGTTTTITSSQTTNRTLTLPDATDTLAGKATTDVFTNKSISGSTNTLSNIALASLAAAAYDTAATASTLAQRDANANLTTNNFISSYNTTATAAGTTTLTVGSKYLQYFTGSTTQTVTLPVVSTLVTGQQFCIVNLSSGNVTVQSSGANSLQVMVANTTLIVTCISTSGTGIASWSASYVSLTGSGNASISGQTNHGVVVSGSSTTMTSTAAGSAGQVLQSGGASADPTYSTATFPSTATGTGTILRANGTNWVASTATYPNTIAINRVLFANGTDAVSSSGTFLFNGSKLLVNTSTNTDGTVASDFAGATANGFCANDTSSVNGSTFIVFETGGSVRGSITNNNNTGVLYNVTSDYRLKENVKPMLGGLDRILLLKPVTYTFKENDVSCEGFLAHEMQEVIPYGVAGIKDEIDINGKPKYQSVDLSKIVPHLVSAIQELKIEIEKLKENK